MKKRDLIKKLKDHGFVFSRYGSGHDIWIKGEKKISIPRHNEINPLTAMRILKDAEGAGEMV